MTGNPYRVSVRTTEILDKLEKHPIWQRRAQQKSAAPQGMLVGTGVACVTKDYGSGADCSLGRVELSPEGRIAIYCDHVEMGNGIGTALANRVAMHLGAVADEVSVARVDSYDVLELITSGDPYTMDQKTQDVAERNPRWVPAISSATSASIGAHVGTHSAGEAARVIFRFGLWPAALELWRIAPNDPRAKQWSKALWKDGQLVLANLAPLPLPALAAKAHARSLVTGAVAHSFSRWDGRARVFSSMANNIAPRSMHWRCAREVENSRALTGSASGFRQPTTTGSAPPIPRCAARWSASRSSAPAARCASPRLTASSNADGRWCRRW
jgi:CO/xanthine dehydrogenase Mo-binding subunit